MITKTKFVTVQPKSEIAKERFAGCMDYLHSCKVVEESFESFLKSPKTFSFYAFLVTH